MRRKLCLVSLWTLLLMLLTLAACEAQPGTSSAPSNAVLLGTPVGTSDQADLAAGLTQVQDNANNQAAATALIVQADAQATLNSANATLSAAQTQDQNNVNAIAAQVAATSAIVLANAQATLNSANSTQSAALTQDAIRQTQVQNDLQATDAAMNTQTAVANLIATQTQSALATSEWYAEQDRQLQQQRQGPISFLWIWCLPIFIVLLAGLCLWGLWRWLKTLQNRQRIIEKPIQGLEDKFLPPESDIVNGRYRLTQPDDQIHDWLDEIKRKLLRRDEDDDDNSNSRS